MGACQSSSGNHDLMNTATLQLVSCRQEIGGARTPAQAGHCLGNRRACRSLLYAHERYLQDNELHHAEPHAPVVGIC